MFCHSEPASGEESLGF